ncbi:DegT/DnrJ/EryC1/StrS family aminotransferase, partial [Luteitalea sp.]|uniref:DegT/DnrJ/EryC1/StrS family aminotransferase n=1 Tax=Luteitalea sp. TaxID=2004800 RepID=UPI0025C5BF43
MQPTFRYVAPAGAPIGAFDLARWAARLLSGGDVSTGLAGALKSRLGADQVFLTSTGRAGLTILLQAMRDLAPPERNEVILPAYTCYSVAASVIKAGLVPKVIDISASTLDYDREELEAADFTRALALVATNLYGLPNDLPALSTLAKARGVFLIDDAAQALGAVVGGRPSGTWGDAGLYSFDKGKNISAIDGGAIVTQSHDLAASLKRRMDVLTSAGPKAAAMMIAKTAVYSMMLRPWLYWIPHSLPQLGLGQTVFTTDFPLAKPTTPEIALAQTMLGRLEQFTAARTSKAAALLEGLRATHRLTPIEPLA